ncbi:hypothetical protein BD410DRAFT_901691 [Rickenella mellea]|uniref:Uncharacterized protein n=1 Tax=Rickenella mellea TaxID=50990 RepID=A0A4Y7PP43_9AGAM|nr:hypothetical protein BD410DRAFT_901691 [Rickenella mellea]
MSSSGSQSSSPSSSMTTSTPGPPSIGNSAVLLGFSVFGLLFVFLGSLIICYRFRGWRGERIQDFAAVIAAHRAARRYASIPRPLLWDVHVKKSSIERDDNGLLQSNDCLGWSHMKPLWVRMLQTSGFGTHQTQTSRAGTSQNSPSLMTRLRRTSPESSVTEPVDSASGDPQRSTVADDLLESNSTPTKVQVAVVIRMPSKWAYHDYTYWSDTDDEIPYPLYYDIGVADVSLTDQTTGDTS